MVLDEALQRASTRSRGTISSHRVPSSVVRGRVMIAAVAVGAFAAAAAGQTLQSPRQASNDVLPVAGNGETSAFMGMGGTNGSAAPDVLAAVSTTDASLEAKNMAENARITEALSQQGAKQEPPDTRGQFFKPTTGTLTSSFGARWGKQHYGLDIANKLLTPIYAVADGEVIEAGAASGFGLWVRIEHADGTISVYGHMTDFSVKKGDKVRGGEQIARMGSRGYSTGSHLHIEIWDANGSKLDPKQWLLERGIRF